MSEFERSRLLTRWAPSVVALTVTAQALFWGFYAIDYYRPDWQPLAGTMFGRYMEFDAVMLSDAFASLAGVIAAIFGIVVTVVSIIVQLTADRFAGVTRMFLRDRVNLVVIGYYIVACVCGVWLSPALRQHEVPKTALLGMLVMTTFGLVLMAPYFGYVFWFLEPMNIVQRIRQRAQMLLFAGSRKRASLLHETQRQVLLAVEELTDIVRHSIADKDKIVASGAVDALKDLVLRYLDAKPQAQADWFSVGPRIVDNPDFVAMDAESLAELETRRTWFEWKVMRQYLGLYNEALAGLRDINYLIAIDTRYVGEAALDGRDEELSRLVLRYMNSYLRATLNAGDVRTAYNVLNQYRMYCEAMLERGASGLACEAARHMCYYGHVSLEQRLTFVTETVAFDLATLCELAHARASDAEEALLGQFLDLDRPLQNEGQEKGLLGVRKAQAKLACYYLASGALANARRIASDMADEPPERLSVIRRQLSQVTSKDFWEIIDRGRNFDFMEPELRGQLARFFDELVPSARSDVSQAT